MSSSPRRVRATSMKPHHLHLQLPSLFLFLPLLLHKTDPPHNNKWQNLPKTMVPRSSVTS